MKARRLNITRLALLFFAPVCAVAQEAVLQSQPIQGEAHKLEVPSSASFRIEAPAEPAPWGLRDKLREAPAFFRDLSLSLNVRSFYFARQEDEDSPGNDHEKISWATGGSAALKSGKLADIFSIGAEIFTSPVFCFYKGNDPLSRLRRQLSRRASFMRKYGKILLLV